jgi:hypothetical protein
MLIAFGAQTASVRALRISTRQAIRASGIELYGTLYVTDNFPNFFS